MFQLGVAAAGVVVGWILGLAVPVEVLQGLFSGENPAVADGADSADFGVLPSLFMAALFASLGWFLSPFFLSQSGFYQGMMLVVINERRSVIRPEMVTEQVEVWIPKVLLSWRAHEWRYTNGRPYLWLQLEPGDEVHEKIKGTLDCLFLQNDLFRAKDAAVYARRSYNRMISDNALDFADVDAGEDGQPSQIKEFVPYLFAIGIVLAGVLLVLLTMD